ncbi:MAG: hydroxymethylglutaryl-CoA reductase, degradative, partial [Thermoplasmatota archaeon]
GEARRSLASGVPALFAAAAPAQASLEARGGGLKQIELKRIDLASGEPALVLHLYVDVVDAMGANAVNTICEAVAPVAEELSGGRALLKILSNLADRRVAHAHAVFSAADLGGAEVARDIVRAFEVADADPYRAATHNKGIMNGIDAVVVATGNDWRAVEAGAHAYATRTGRYRSLSRFALTPTGDLEGWLDLPLAVGTVGGVTRTHPHAHVAKKILGVGSAAELAAVAASVGLAQNVAALRALVAEGIQRGHMRLHARNLVRQAGVPEPRVEEVLAALLAEGKTPTAGRAGEIWKEMEAKR